MWKKIRDSIIELTQGDITDQDTDVIVNAASKSLQGGGGVDEAILEVGGSEILEECRQLGGCEVGDAKITSAGNLNANCIVHAVGPKYYDGMHGEPELLASAYARSLELALDCGAVSVSFPSISTGAHGYPPEEAARIALTTTSRFLEEHDGIELVRFVLLEYHTYQAFEEALKERTWDD